MANNTFLRGRPGFKPLPLPDSPSAQGSSSRRFLGTERILREQAALNQPDLLSFRPATIELRQPIGSLTEAQQFQAIGALFPGTTQSQFRRFQQREGEVERIIRKGLSNITPDQDVLSAQRTLMRSGEPGRQLAPSIRANLENKVREAQREQNVMLGRFRGLENIFNIGGTSARQEFVREQREMGTPEAALSGRLQEFGFDPDTSDIEPAFRVNVPDSLSEADFAAAAAGRTTPQDLDSLAQRPSNIKIPSPQELQRLSSQGLTEADIVRQDGEIFIKGSSPFARLVAPTELATPEVPEDIPIAGPGQLQQLAAQGLTEGDIRRVGGDLFIKGDSGFARTMPPRELATAAPITTPRTGERLISSPEELQRLAAQGVTEADLRREGDKIFLKGAEVGAQVGAEAATAEERAADEQTAGIFSQVKGLFNNLKEKFGVRDEEDKQLSDIRLQIADRQQAIRNEVDAIQAQSIPLAIMNRQIQNAQAAANRDLADLAVRESILSGNIEQAKADMMNQIRIGIDLARLEDQLSDDEASELDRLLSISEAQTLGLPFGTTVGQAAELGIVPEDAATRAARAARAARGAAGAVGAPGVGAPIPQVDLLPEPTFEDFISQKQEELGMSIAPEFSGDFRPEFDQIIRDIRVANENRQRQARMQLLSPNARAVLLNPNVFANLSSKEKGNVSVELTLGGFDTPGVKAGKKQQLPAGQLASMNQALIARSNVKEIDRRINELIESDLIGIGPGIGGIRSANPFDVKVRELNNLIVQTVPGLARGVFGEVGVLTDVDRETYASTLANPSLPPETARAISKSTLKQVEDSIQIQLDSFESAGYDVEELRKRIFSDLPIATEKPNKTEKDHVKDSINLITE